MEYRRQRQMCIRDSGTIACFYSGTPNTFRLSVAIKLFINDLSFNEN